jgi:hypothetical protein
VSTRRTRRKRTLPAGWSYPLKPSEVPALFPAGEVTFWAGRPQNWRSRSHVPVGYAQWSNESALRQPTLFFYAVRSEERADIKNWIEIEAAPAFARWFAQASASPVWREANRWQHWNFSKTETDER